MRFLLLLSLSVLLDSKIIPFQILLINRIMKINMKKYIQNSNILKLPYTNFTDDDMRRALLLF